MGFRYDPGVAGAAVHVHIEHAHKDPDAGRRPIEGFKIIDTVFILTGGGPGTSTETLTLFAYNEGFKKFNIGMTSALSFLFLIVVIVFGTLYLAGARKLTQRYAQ